MALEGVLAYPVIVLTMVAVWRLGVRERWGRFEWMRMAALSLMTGILIAVHVKLAMLGVIHEPVPLAFAIVTLGSTAGLLGLYFYERWNRERLPQLTAVLRV